MSDRYSTLRQSLIDSVLTTPGDTSSDLRRRVEARAAEHAGIERQTNRESAETELPEEMTGYLDKVSQHAYKVVDQDVEALKAKGYSEDAIFELTLSAALGAGMSRLERGLAALKGAN